MLQTIKLLSKGKVRDIYAIDKKYLLMVTTDRLSAFDVIIPNLIPGKGCILNQISNFWFAKMQHIIPNHLTDIKLADIISDPKEHKQLAGRSVIVKRLKPLPVEAIVRGYLAGSGWKDYNQSGKVCGVLLDKGLRLAQQLRTAIYTPSSKAIAGKHDKNITFSETVTLLGEDIANMIKETSLKLYTEAANFAKKKDIIIADAKFEFGLDDNGKLYLIDELLTPESSRFWLTQSYQIGISPPSFDKQYVRDYLESLNWNKTTPAPSLPTEVIKACVAKYEQAREKLIF